MTLDPSTSLQAARDEFYARHGFPADGGRRETRWSPVGCRDLKVYLPNFEWRRRALPFHDLHHILTGYPFSPTGEFEMAAWEFAAGRFPNAFSTLFCLPLVGLGALLTPRRAFAAFVRGRRSRTLYDGFDYTELLNRTVADVRDKILPENDLAATPGDFVEYGKLVGLSALLMLAPFVALALVLRGLL